VSETAPGTVRASAADVTVVIPAHNSAGTIARTARSVAGEASVREVLVCDDGSSDETASVAAEIGGKVRVLPGAKGGAPKARNRGLAAAASSHVLFLDADDYVEPGYVDRLAAHAGDGETVVLGSHRQIAGDGRVVREIALPQAGRAETIAAYLAQPLQTACFLWPRGVLAALGGWDETLVVFQDIELALRFFSRGVAYTTLPAGSPVAIWLENDSPSRISNSFGPAKARGQITALRRNAEPLSRLGAPVVDRALHRMLYAATYRAYLHGFTEIGREGERALRELGFRGHFGGTPHRLVAGAVGLRGKAWLTRRLNARS
jgi:glycosyltransferase involved in cell wall biosynthesis